MFGTKVLIFSTATILKPPKARHFALRNLHYIIGSRPEGRFTSAKLVSLLKSYTLSRRLYLEEVFYCVISYSKISKHKKIRKTNFCC